MQFGNARCFRVLQSEHRSMPNSGKLSLPTHSNRAGILMSPKYNTIIIHFAGRLCTEVSLQPLTAQGSASLNGSGKSRGNANRLTLRAFFIRLFGKHNSMDSGASRRPSLPNSSTAKSPIAEKILMECTLWGTFYEIIDDTCQIAKSHVSEAVYLACVGWIGGWMESRTIGFPERSN